MPRRSATSNAAPEPLERVEAAVREVIRGIAPELHMVKRWGMPWLAGNDLVVLPGRFSHHVGVEFWRGTELSDPHHLLEGTGKDLRHVKLRTVRDATSPAMVALLREAVRRDQTEPPRYRSTAAPGAR